LKDFELMLVIDATLDSEATEKVIAKVEKLIEKNGGKIEKSEKWGKRRLAFPIKKHDEGYYYIIIFNGEGKTVNEIDRVLKITDEILRHMLVRKQISKKQVSK